LDKFHENLGSFTDEHEEIFLQDIKGSGEKIPGKVECQYDIITVVEKRFFWHCA
jgi:hypothetical protein